MQKQKDSGQITFPCKRYDFIPGPVLSCVISSPNARLAQFSHPALALVTVARRSQAGWTCASLSDSDSKTRSWQRRHQSARGRKVEADESPVPHPLVQPAACRTEADAA